MAVNDTWVRNRTVTPITTGLTDVDVVDIPLNDTLLRAHGSVAVIMSLPNHSPFSAAESAHLVGALYTTLSVGGTLLNPANTTGDFAPPLQRYLWWEELHPVAQPAAGKQFPDSRQVWQFLPAQQPLDIKAQVRATTAISLHLVMFVSNIPSNVKDFDMWWWFSVLRSGL